ncbi:MAG: hypothetical protein ACMUHU_00445 [Thermoplasmatota archaeon]
MSRKVLVYPFETGADLSRKDIQRIIGRLGTDGLPVLMDLDAIFGSIHLASGIMHAARAIFNDEARAREPSIEVLRWLSGSHQVLQGILSVGPGSGTRRLLLSVLPSDWPAKEDASVLPDIAEIEWKGVELPQLRPLGVPFNYGEDSALRALGLDPESFSGHEEKERAVLEVVCLPGLK